MIYFVVFITSAATLAFELAGARMLAPYLGTSTEVWAGVIGTILGGLTLGYWLGGKAADKHPNREWFAGAVFLSGVAVAFAWAFRDLIPAIFIHLPLGALTFTAFGIGLILFVPASMFFGAISPFAAKLSLDSLDDSARTVGRLSAMGALGSIVGTVATSSWLMPRVGMSDLLMGISVFLMALSFAIAWRSKAIQRLLVGAFVIAAAGGLSDASTESMGLLADIDTPYGRVWIRETTDEGSGFSVRSIHLDPYGIQCASFVEPDGTVRDELVFNYTKTFDLAVAAKPDAERALVIGGCNYSYPDHLLSKLPEAAIDVVEIDPGMTEIAREYFGFVQSDRMTIYHEDGRTYLNRADARYDLVFSDAFTSAASTPFHLATREAVEHAARLLGENGILAINTIGAAKGDVSGFVAAEVATLRSVFESVRVFQVGRTAPQATQNLLILASDDAAAIDNASVDRFVALAPTDIGVELVEVPVSSFADARILTDDYAPVEHLTKMLRERRLGEFRR